MEVIDLPAGTHHFKVRPEEGGLDFCDIKVSIDQTQRLQPILRFLSDTILPVRC